MANLKETRNRISSVRSTQQITKAMKMVAAAKLRKAQERIINIRPYNKKLREVMANLSDSVEGSPVEPYFEKRELHRVLFVPITSDRGLCGSFNNAIGKLTAQKINTHYPTMYKDRNAQILSIGKRAHDYFRNRNYPIVDSHDGIFNELSFERAQSIADHLMDLFLKGEYDEIFLVHNSFYNPAVYQQLVVPFLPVKLDDESQAKKSQFLHDYIFEPDKFGILSELVPRTLRINLYSALLDSNAAEHGARMTAMDNATDNASELLEDLRIEYNKARQAAITKEILEIVSGADALASS
jgi:F-type H+-transporting ATPase subunit gamma